MRFLVDHNVGRGVAKALSDDGYDVVFAGDVNPTGQALDALALSR
jgi:hypothetical protein